MSFEHLDEHDELRASLRSFLASRSPEAQVRRLMDTATGYDRSLWEHMASQLGLQGLGIPERLGGGGYGIVELQIVLEEMGRVLLGAPFLSTVGLCVPVLLACDDDVAAELVPLVAAGSLTLALAGGGAEGQVGAQTDAGAWSLEGETPFVLDGLAADRLLVRADTADGPTLFVVDDPATTTRTSMRTLDQTRHQARIAFANSPARLVGPLGGADEILEQAMVTARTLLAAEGAGVCARMVEMAVDYAKVRHQFGRAIGSFQAVKHLCTQMHIDTELATSAARGAGWALREGAPDASLLSRVAAAATCEALDSVAAEMIEVHGGIGFTWEHPAHLFYKRAVSSARIWGSATEHRAAIFTEASA